MRGQVPTARVAPIIADLIEERWPAKRRPEGEAWGISILAENVGCHPDTIDHILRQKCEGAEFNLIDQILCSLGRPDYWWGVLSDLYWRLDLRGDPAGYLPAGMRRCQRIGCANLFTPSRHTPKDGPRAQRFCSKQCQTATHHQHKVGLKKGAYGPRGKLRRMACQKGHDFTPENTWYRRDGKRMCRACRNERQRAWRKRVAHAA